MRFSSSFKVGLLTLTALLILIFSILWIKGRALSAGERLFVDFKDVNGIRPGSAVQMMGFRIGQIEEITPVLSDMDDPYVRGKICNYRTGYQYTECVHYFYTTVRYNRRTVS